MEKAIEDLKNRPDLEEEKRDRILREVYDRTPDAFTYDEEETEADPNPDPYPTMDISERDEEHFFRRVREARGEERSRKEAARAAFDRFRARYRVDGLGSVYPREPTRPG